ncbi:MAG: hypothetical protein ACR2G5_10500 [Pyrinomonadaceae bacterium]
MRASILSLLLLLSTSPQSQEDATVYFFREPKSETLVKYAIEVSCDGIKLGKLQPSRYFAVALKPGKHVCRSTEKSQKPIELDLKANESRYFEMRTREHFFKFTGYLIPVGSEQGIEIIKTLRPSDRKDMRSELVTVPSRK